MLELYVVKATRTVPRRERGGNPSDLADKLHARFFGEGLETGGIRSASLLPDKDFIMY